ncbi:hypothetical protein GW750_05075 [bacterium]|nr:hypothetical protein [bacterium]
MDIKEERNKYLLLSEPEQYDATYGVATNYTMLQENVENIEKKLQSRDFSNQDLVS